MLKKDQISHREGQASGNVHLFYGDEFLVKEQVNKMVADLLPAEERATNYVVLDGSNLDIAALTTHLSTPSLFGGRRVVLVEQTPLFVGKIDRDKLMDKAVAFWKTHDRKAAHRVFGQIMGAAGVSVADLNSSNDWLSEVYPDPAAIREIETLLSIAQSFVESGERVGSGGDETAVADLIERGPDDDVTLIFTAPAVDKRKKLFKVFEKRGTVTECAVREEKFGAGMDRGFFEERVRQGLSREGKTIARDALETMYSRAGKEVRRLHSEIEKLMGYVGERTHITNVDVQAVFTDFHETAFYEINSAVRSGDMAKCLTALHENLKIVAHPLHTLGAIANEFRRLMNARELLFTVFRSKWKPSMTYQQFVPIAKQVREAHPELLSKGKFSLLGTMKDYPLYLTLRDAQRFDMQRLMAIMEAILDTDILLKSTRLGGTAPDLLMERLIIKICDPALACKG